MVTAMTRYIASVWYTALAHIVLRKLMACCCSWLAVAAAVAIAVVVATVAAAAAAAAAAAQYNPLCTAMYVCMRLQLWL